MNMTKAAMYNILRETKKHLDTRVDRTFDKIKHREISFEEGADRIKSRHMQYLGMLYYAHSVDVITNDEYHEMTKEALEWTKQLSKLAMDQIGCS